MECRTEDGWRWHVVRPWESVLLTSAGMRLDKWLANGQARCVKSRAGRATYLVHLADRDVYVKRHGPGGLGQALADWFRGSAARREWNRTLEAQRRGVPTARPIAFGEQTCHGQVRASCLVTEAIEGAVPLDRFVRDRIETLSPGPRQELRRRLLHRVARFVARLHQAGVRHGDFHAGNLLVVGHELEDDRRPAVYLIDLADARFSGPLEWPAVRASLIVLHAEWFDRLTVAERWRFLRTYLAHRPALHAPPRDARVDQLDRGARAHSRRIDRRRDRRALAANRDFVVARRPGRRLHAVAELPEAVREQFLRQPASLVLGALDRPVKISHTTLMVCAPWPLGDEEIAIRVGLKRCRPRTAWKALVDRFRRSRALRGWCLGHALVARRIDTARPLAVCDARREDRPNPWAWWPRWLPSRESYLATEWIDGTENLHLWAWRLAKRPPEERLRWARRCAESLGRLLGRMHARRVSHRDLKASNLLVKVVGKDVRTWLIDTDGARIQRRLSARRRAADLARLATSVEAHPWVTRSVRYRFLREYARQFSRGEVNEKSIWRSVARRAKRLVSRKKREGKPVL